MFDALKIKENDNVAVAIEPIKVGSHIKYSLADGRAFEMTVNEDIQIYHKFSTRDISKGMPVYKYGEIIGIAVCDIKAGYHVHTHNIKSEQEIMKEAEEK